MPQAQEQSPDEPGVVVDESPPLNAPQETAPESGPAETSPMEPAAVPVRLTRVERETYERRRRRFTACGRCGYLLADCQVYVGQPTLQAAVLDAGDGWLRLEGDATFHRLVKNAYGVELDTEFDLFDGLCPECLRRLVIVNDESGVTLLKIHL